MKVVVIPGLTLREVSDEDVARIREAGGDADVVVTNPEAAETEIADADVVFGFVSRRMYLGAQNLRWVHAISSGVDAFLYDEFKDSDVVLTSEKGLVGEHLADTGFGLLLMLTRQLAAAQRYGCGFLEPPPRDALSGSRAHRQHHGHIRLRRHRPRHGPSCGGLRHGRDRHGPRPRGALARGG